MTMLGISLVTGQLYEDVRAQQRSMTLAYGTKPDLDCEVDPSGFALCT